MKRLALASAFIVAGGAGFAADLPPPPPAPATYVPVVVPPYNWSGPYIGNNLGAGWAGGNWTDNLGPPHDKFTMPANAQLMGGGQIGANYEFWNGAVIGVEADFEWAPNSNNTSNTVIPVTAGGHPTTVTLSDRWLTLLTGRLGYAWDRVLFYGKGGAAWVGASNPTITDVTTGASITPSFANSNWGWTAGAGVEWAFWDTWSLRIEYDYIGLNGQTFTVPAPGSLGFPTGTIFTGNNRNIQMANFGINYKFWH
jgi:outer membrane immunogenic protein